MTVSSHEVKSEARLRAFPRVGWLSRNTLAKYELSNKCINQIHGHGTCLAGMIYRGARASRFRLHCSDEADMASHSYDSDPAEEFYIMCSLQ